MTNNIIDISFRHKDWFDPEIAFDLSCDLDWINWEDLELPVIPDIDFANLLTICGNPKTFLIMNALLETRREFLAKGLKEEIISEVFAEIGKSMSEFFEKGSTIIDLKFR